VEPGNADVKVIDDRRDVVIDGDNAIPATDVGDLNQDKGVGEEASTHDGADVGGVTQQPSRAFHVKRDDEVKVEEELAIAAWKRQGESGEDDEHEVEDDENATSGFAAALNSYKPRYKLDAPDDVKATPSSRSSSTSSSSSSSSRSSSSSSSSSRSTSSSSSSSSGSSSSEQENGKDTAEWNEEDEEKGKTKQPPGLSLRGMLTRQDHIRHVADDDIEYFTPTDSDEEFGLVPGGKHGDEGRSLTPPMSPKSKTRYRCIKGELAARKSRTEELRAKHNASQALLEAAAKKLEDQVDRASIASDASDDAADAADMRLRTSLFTKTNGLSQFPVCTCNGLPTTTLGPKDRVQYASYCQVHFPFAPAKMGRFGTSHSEAHVEEATRRLREIFIQEQERELQESEKKKKLDVFRGQFSSMSNPDSYMRYGGDTDDSDWDLANVSRTIRQPGGPPLVIPNPHIERSKRRIKELREANGFQLFETRTHYMIVTNDAMKTAYRVAKIARFSDEFSIDEDPFLYSQLQVQNLLKMASQSQQGCKLVSSGTGIVGFIQLFSFESCAETGLDLDGVNGAVLGDTIRITEQIYRKHVRAMKRKELMFAFLEHTKTARGAPSYLEQFGHKQGYTLFSGADKVRPVGAYGSRASAREIPKQLRDKDKGRSSSVHIGASDLNINMNGDDDAKKDANKPAWYARILESIDSSIDAREQAKQKELAKLKSKKENTESEDEREAKKKEEEEEAAALVASSADWTKLILEGFIAPEIPTDNALPGKVLQVASNKYIYRTKYLTVFNELEPSEDEDTENDFGAEIDEEGDGVNSTDSETELMPSKMSKELGRSFANEAIETGQEKPALSVLASLKKLALFRRQKSSKIQVGQQATFKGRDEPLADAEKPDDSKNIHSVLERASTVPKPKGHTPEVLKRSHTAGVGEIVDLLKREPTLTKETTVVEAKPKKATAVNVKENAVLISSNKYAEDLDDIDTEDDDDEDEDEDEESESELSEEDAREFVEYTLIERILIFLGFLEDNQAKAKEVESDSDDAPGMFSRAYSAMHSMASKSMGSKNPVAEAAKEKKAVVPEPTPTRFKRPMPNKEKDKEGNPAEKKKETTRMTAEELEEAIEEKRLKLDARAARRKERARLRAEREKAREKAQKRINRYRFDPEQAIVKLRFKSFGSHAPLLL